MMPTSFEKRYVQAVGLVSALCLALFLIRVALTGSTRYLFIPENLALCWASIIFAWLLLEQLRTHPWSNWRNLALTILWLVFLPNSWYVLTDFIHVYTTGEINQLFDIVMMSTLLFSGFTLGFTSLYLIHCQLYKQLGSRLSAWVVATIILLSSFAIYLGRILRWNTWDVVANPSGLIINVSDRIVDPFGNWRALNMTALFFLLLATMYLAIWLFLGPVARTNRGR